MSEQKVLATVTSEEAERLLSSKRKLEESISIGEKVREMFAESKKLADESIRERDAWMAEMREKYSIPKETRFEFNPETMTLNELDKEEVISKLFKMLKNL